MLDHGLIDEVRRLRSDPRIHADLPAMRAVGYRQVWQALDDPAAMSELSARGAAATRQLAKRQLTWLRAEYDAFWIDSASSSPQRLLDQLRRRVGAFVPR